MGALGIPWELSRGWLPGPRQHQGWPVGWNHRSIQLRISGGAINFERVIVRYGNGTQEEIAIRSRIPDGGQTRVIDLPGERRIIQSLDLWYGRDKWSRRPKMSPLRIKGLADCPKATNRE